MWFAYVRNFKAGCRVEITVKKYNPKRSDRQNRYYWSVVVGYISAYTGQLPEEAHEGLKSMFLKVHHDKLPYIRSTASLTTKEFNDYVEQCIVWAAQFLGVAIPDPDAVEY